MRVHTSRGNDSWDATVQISNSTVGLTNVVLDDNTSGYPAGSAGVSAYGSTLTIRNSLIADNQSDGDVGAILASGGSVAVFSSTVAGNTASGASPALLSASGSSSVTITNSVVWGNSPTNLNVASGATISVSYSDVQGSGGSGTGNLDVDPQFHDASIGNYSLGTTSTVRDKGTNAQVLSTDLDLYLGPRIRLLTTDMGAYEAMPVCGNYSNPLRVDIDATGTATGSSWVNVDPVLVRATEIAGSCQNVDEIWVAEGTYKPSATGDESKSFELSSGLALLGGFDGTETTASQADPAANSTVLSGDLNGNDDGAFGFRSDNTDYVVTADRWVIDQARVDGFTITGGDNLDLGFERGSAVHVVGGNVALTRAVVSRNRTFLGPIYATYEDVNVNDALDPGEPTAVLDLVGVEVVDNEVTRAGGAVVGLNSALRLVNTLLADNALVGPLAFAPGLYVFGGSADVYNSTIVGNKSNDITFPWGGVHSAGAAVSVRNSIVRDNLPTNVTGNPDNLVSVFNSDVGALDPSIPGADNVDVDPSFVNAAAGNYRLTVTSPLLNAGSHAAPNLPPPDSFDLDGDGNTTELTPDLDRHPRVVNGVIDLGAYENQTLTDSDADGVPDVSDNCPSVSNSGQADINGDGLGDVCDPVNNAAVFVSLTPARYADSRNQTTFDAQFRNTGPRAGGTTWEIKIAGRGLVPADATAAVINVTALRGTGTGFATVHPCGSLPTASSINFRLNTTEPNEVVAKLSPSGTVCVYTNTTADIIADVVGYTPNNSPYTALTPARYADSRDQPTFDDTFRNTGQRAGGTVWEIPIAGRGNVPTTATAAVVNLTVAGATANGWAAAYPCGDLPATSSVNYGPGIVRPNELITKLSPTGTVCIYTDATTHVIADVVGYVDTVPRYTPLTPARYADTRNQPTFDDTFRNTGQRAGGTVWEIPIAGRGNVPTTATAATINLTVTGATTNGWAAAYPCGDLPATSSINYGPGITRSNELITKLSPTGTVCIYTDTATHVIIDTVGHN